MNLVSKTGPAVVLLFLLELAAIAPVHAQVGLFNFEGDATGTQTPFSNTSGGITATFSAPGGPGGFVVGPNPAYGSVLLSGQVLGEGFGTATGANIPLNIAFSRNLSSLTLDFANASFRLLTPQTFTLQAFENGVSVGILTVPGLVPNGGSNAEGVIGFFGPVFNSVQLSSATSISGQFAIDNIGIVGAPPVPEASTTVSLGLLLVLGMGGMVVAARRKKAARSPESPQR